MTTPAPHAPEERPEGEASWAALPALLTLCLLGSSALFGAVHHGPAWALVVVLGALVLMGALRSAPPSGSTPRGLVPLLVGGLVLQALGLLSLLPVGADLRQLAQPGLAPLVDRSLAEAGANTHWLAVDPPAALRAWAAGSALLGVLGLVALTSARLVQARRLLQGLVLLALVVLTTALVHTLTGATSIWWTSGVPAFAREAFFAPFVNPNHAGALLAACLPLALGLGLAGDANADPAFRSRGARSRGSRSQGSRSRGSRSRSTRSRGTRELVSAAAMVVLLAGIWFTRSRGAMVEAAVAMGVMGFLLGPRPLRGALLVLLLAGLGVMAWIGPVELTRVVSDLVIPEVYRPDPLGQRPSLWREGARLLEAAPWLGIGQGGFEDAFPVVKRLPVYGQASHVHLDLLEVLMERGPVLGGAWLLLMATPVLLGLRRALRMPAGDTRTLLVASLAAATSLALACVPGFPLRTGALALFAAVLGGACLGIGAAPARGPLGARLLRPLLLGLGALALLPAGLALSTTGAWTPTEAALSEVESLRDQARQPGADAAPLLEEAEALAAEALARRPLSHGALLQLAETRYARGDTAGAARALTLLTEVYPTLPGAWIALARLQARAGQQQEAMGSWRQALSLDLPDNDDAEPSIREALALGADPGTTAMAVIPDRPDRLRVAGRILASMEDDLVAELLLQRGAELDPDSGLVYAAQLVKWGRAEEALPLTEGFRPDHCTARRVAGDAYLALDRPQEAIEAYKAALAGCRRGKEDLRQDLGLALLAAGDPKAVPMLEEALQADPQKHALRRKLIGLLHRLGRSREAVAHYDALDAAGVLKASEGRDRTRARLGMPPKEPEAPPSPDNAPPPSPDASQAPG